MKAARNEDVTWVAIAHLFDVVPMTKATSKPKTLEWTDTIKSEMQNFACWSHLVP